MKKILTAVLTIWLGGAIVMSVYYELKLRADCIKEEGLLKGFFWCDKQPINPAGYLWMQTNFLVRGLAWPYFLFSSSDRTVSERRSGSWAVTDKGTPFTVATAIPISKEDNFKAILLVFFNPKNSCNPELSFLAIANDKLGDPESRDMTSTRMQVSVGSILKKDYPTVFNKYTSGIEYAMRLDDVLMGEMKGSQSIFIAPSNTTQNWTFPLNGFQTLATSQYAACKNS